MHIKPVTAIISIVLAFWSCQYSPGSPGDFQSDSGNSTDTIGFSSYEQHIRLSDIVEGVKFIPLESPAGSLIGVVDKIKYVDERFYLLDVKVTSTLFVFDKKGKFIYQVDHIGQGPGEFTKPYDFEVTHQGIHILDYNTRELRTYDHKGAFQSTAKLPFFANSFAALNSPATHFAFYNRINMEDNAPEFNTLRVLNTKLEVIKEGLKIDAVRSQLMLGTPYAFGAQSGVETLFTPHFSNFIYSVSPDFVIPKFYVDFGPHSIPNGFWQQNALPAHVLDNHVANKGYAYGLNNPVETKTHLAFSFYKDRQVYFAVYDKCTKAVKSGFLIDDDMFQMFLDFKIYCSFEDKAVALINLPDLHQRVEDAKSFMTASQFRKYQKQYSFLFGFLSIHSRDNNPVLAIVQPKAFDPQAGH